MEVNPTGIYTRKQVAEILGCSERTIDYYYTQGLQKRKLRSRNYTTGRQILEFIEKDEIEYAVPNRKLMEFRQNIR